MINLIKITHSAWMEEGKRIFGPDPLKWKFVCPSCGYIAAVEEWRDAKAPEGAVAFSCVGRYTGSKKEMGDKTGGPCNYTSGGLFNISPVTIILEDGKESSAFAFSESEKSPTSEVEAAA